MREKCRNPAYIVRTEFTEMLLLIIAAFNSCTQVIHLSEMSTIFLTLLRIITARKDWGEFAISGGLIRLKEKYLISCG